MFDQLAFTHLQHAPLSNFYSIFLMKITKIICVAKTIQLSLHQYIYSSKQTTKHHCHPANDQISLCHLWTRKFRNLYHVLTQIHQINLDLGFKYLLNNECKISDSLINASWAQAHTVYKDWERSHYFILLALIQIWQGR